MRIWRLKLANDIDICVVSGTPLRDGPLENLWGGGGSTKKNIRTQENLNEKKNSCTPINPKKYSCYGLKTIHTKYLITKINSCNSKIPGPWG